MFQISTKKDMKQNIDLFDITTNNLEKYKCALPVDLTDEELIKLENVNGILILVFFDLFFLIRIIFLNRIIKY